MCGGRCERQEAASPGSTKDEQQLGQELGHRLLTPGPWQDTGGTPGGIQSSRDRAGVYGGATVLDQSQIIQVLV